MARIRPQKVIVTSNYSIEECFPDENSAGLQALKRRFVTHHYSKPAGV